MRKNEIECPVVPMPGYIVVQPLEAEGRSKGGIIIPDGAKEKPTRGAVVAVGQHAQSDGMGFMTDEHTGDTMACLPVQTGDVVIFGKHAGSEIDVDGARVVVLSWKDIIAKIGD